MRNFGNFLVKQSFELRKLLVDNYKDVFDTHEIKNYVQNLNEMDHKELVEHAKSLGVKIPCPSNY